MRKQLALFLTIVILAFTGCSSDYTTVYTEVNQVDGVTLTLKQDTLKSSRATFLLTNASDAEIVYDPVEFHLEQWKDDTWQENVGTRESMWKRDTTEPLAAGASKELEVNWKGLCGTIGNGTHRVILIVNDMPVVCEFEKE